MRTDILQQARAIRASMDAAAIVLTDEQAAKAPRLYPTWAAGLTVKAGDRLYYPGTDRLYKVVSDHTTQADWTPDTAASLYKAIGMTSEGYPEWAQPLGASDAYNTGDIVSYNGKLYKSTIDANVWAPDAYPAGWKNLGPVEEVQG